MSWKYHAKDKIAKPTFSGPQFFGLENRGKIDSRFLYNFSYLTFSKKNI
jgi:hypothetical protein